MGPFLSDGITNLIHMRPSFRNFRSTPSTSQTGNFSNSSDPADTRSVRSGAMTLGGGSRYPGRAIPSSGYNVVRTGATERCGAKSRCHYPGRCMSAMQKPEPTPAGQESRFQPRRSIIARRLAQGTVWNVSIHGARRRHGPLTETLTFSRGHRARWMPFPAVGARLVFSTSWVTVGSGPARRLDLFPAFNLSRSILGIRRISSTASISL